MTYEPASRDLSHLTDSHGNPYPETYEVKDSVIQEVSPAGTELFRWNSWGHVRLDPDCTADGAVRLRRDYAHLNSLHVAGGDLVASFGSCSQVLRIDRSSGSGAVEWQLGGTEPTRDPDTEYLEIVGDAAGEFCSQHQATLTDAGTVLLFDNGAACPGPRKSRPAFTRAVEYDISSGSQASFVREYRHPGGLVSHAEGGVSELDGGGGDSVDTGHWLISWGSFSAPPENPEQVVLISEVDPDSGTALLHVNLSKAGNLAHTYRVYREPETEIDVPLRLP